MKYQQRIDRLREVKERQTLDKLAHNGYMDEDDYGNGFFHKYTFRYLLILLKTQGNICVTL